MYTRSHTYVYMFVYKTGMGFFNNLPLMLPLDGKITPQKDLLS